MGETEDTISLVDHLVWASSMSLSLEKPAAQNVAVREKQG